MSSSAPHLVLVGGGHAHVEVLRRFAVEEHPPARLTLVSLATEHHYSWWLKDRIDRRFMRRYR
jgi:NADH dehydrogenase FAD-containing subunit